MKLLRKTVRRMILEALKFDELGNCILIKANGGTRDLTYYLLLHPEIVDFVSNQFASIHEDLEDDEMLEYEEDDIDWDDYAVLNQVIDEIIFNASSLVLAMAGIIPGGKGPKGAAELKLFAAQSGWGPTLHDVVMGEVDGIIADREEVTPAAFSVYRYYHNNRPDIQKEPLDSWHHKWTPEEDDDEEWGSNGDYGNLGDKSLDDPSITQDQFTKDPLNWIYYGDTVPEAQKAYDNQQQLLLELEAWIDDPEEVLEDFCMKLAKAFFQSKFKRP